MTHPQPRRLTVLAGNGLSIAFDQGLMLPEICRQLYAKISGSSVDGDSIAATMQEIARRSRTGDPRSDFEVLVGAFGSQSETLDQLEKLARFVDPSDQKIGDALRDAAAFARAMNATGTSHVLEIITQQSRASLDKKDALNKFVDAIVDAYSGTVVIANLNYDTLLLSALSERHRAEFCDQGDGRSPEHLTMPNGVTYTCFPLRDTQSFNVRVRLVQLHGSVTFWQREDGSMFKLPVDAVRSPELWAAVREDKKFKPRPLVVLANHQDKTGLIVEEPFALAYREFTSGLDHSDDWLIVGYSFRDECVNERLADAYARRTVPPKVLVVTYGQELAAEDVEAAFGWDRTKQGVAKWLIINRDGANEMADSWDWHIEFKPHIRKAS